MRGRYWIVLKGHQVISKHSSKKEANRKAKWMLTRNPSDYLRVAEVQGIATITQEAEVRSLG